MKFLRIALLFGLALFSNHTLATEIFLETFAPEDASVSTTGWVLLEESYIGIRFSTSESVYLSGTIVKFLGTGTYFSAITSLSSPNGFPTPVPGFLPNDMLAYSERTIIDVLGTPEDHLFDISVTLVPGQYFVFFGSVDQSVGFMP